MIVIATGPVAAAAFLRDVADGVYEPVQVTAADAMAPRKTHWPAVRRLSL